MPATVLKRALAVALTAAVSVARSATVTPSNATDPAVPLAQVELSVVRSADDGAMMPISHVLPLTARAADDLDPPGLTGQLFYATDQSAQRLNSSNIAYINCDPDAYRGNLQAADVLNTAIDRGAIAALFFTTSASYCNVTGIDQRAPFLYSMTNATTSQQVLDDLVATTTRGSQVYFAQIHPAHASSTDNDTMSTTGNSSGSEQDGSSNQSNPLGPSPSTAVAMIILYSITGVITALFLVIIITGALRAHRHPERYGPGVVLNGARGGTSRQTRVRGIARAMLDTLPVVKFGDQTAQQQREPKPTDVEMGETTARNSADEDQQRSGAEARGQQADAATATGAAEPSTTDNTQNPVEGSPRDAAAGTANTSEQRSAGTAEAGIAPAAAGSSAENLASEGDAYTGCTICTEEFEPGQDVRVLPCDHKFHPECIDPWLLNVSGTCPLCRINLNPTSPTDENGPDGNGDSTRRSASILAPPLSPTDAAAANIPAHHRRSVFRDILHLRAPGSSEERLAMARRMAGDRNGGGGNGTSTEDRRRSRLSTLFRRERHASTDEEVPPLPESASAQGTSPR